jgi:hypothetical protein
MSTIRIAGCTGWDVIPKSWLALFYEEKEAYVMLEQVVEDRFGTLAKWREEVLRNPPWARGVIFSRRYELKWRRRFGRWQAVFITDDPDSPIPAGFQEHKGASLGLVENEAQVVLWGVSEPGPEGSLIWFEDRVPRQDLRYPVDGADMGRRAALLYRAYRLHETDHQSMLHRWCGVRLL